MVWIYLWVGLGWVDIRQFLVSDDGLGWAEITLKCLKIFQQYDKLYRIIARFIILYFLLTRFKLDKFRIILHYIITLLAYHTYFCFALNWIRLGSSGSGLVQWRGLCLWVVVGYLPWLLQVGWWVFLVTKGELCTSHRKKHNIEKMENCIRLWKVYTMVSLAWKKYQTEKLRKLTRANCCCYSLS